MCFCLEAIRKACDSLRFDVFLTSSIGKNGCLIFSLNLDLNLPQLSFDCVVSSSSCWKEANKTAADQGDRSFSLVSPCPCNCGQVVPSSVFVLSQFLFALVGFHGPRKGCMLMMALHGATGCDVPIVMSKKGCYVDPCS